MTRIILMLLVAAGTGYAVPGMAATLAQINNSRAQSLAWLYTHQNGDGSWKTASGFKVQPTTLAMDGLANAGLKYAFTYASAQAWLVNVPVSSNDSLARQVSTLAKSGGNVAALTQRLINQRNDNSRGWGAYAKYQAGFPDTGLAMDAILASGVSYADTNYGLGFIAGKQNLDGGWPNSAAEPNTAASHLIPTAQNVLTLSRYVPLGWNVGANITNGVNFLLSKTKLDGGFAEDSSAASGNAYDTALVYLALNQAKLAGNAAAIGAQATLDNAQNFLVTTQAVDGSWNGDALSTALALNTFAATTLTDTNRDGIPDVVRAIIATNPGNSTAKVLLAQGNGLGVSGLNLARLLTNATLGRNFNYSLAVSGGTPPYTFSIASGTVPDGLILDGPSGVISGIPTRLGLFTFNYQVTDATATTSGGVEGQIQVVNDISSTMTIIQLLLK